MIHFLKRHINMSDIFQTRNTNWTNAVDETCSGRQTNQLLLFCDLILKYEKYKLPEEEMNDSLYSPSGSEGTNDSFSTESNSSFNINGSNEDMKNDMSVEEVGVHSTVSQPFGIEDDSWDLITCPCMKPFAGRPMIECSVCQNWLHMSCAKVRKNNIPDDFICQHCRETKSSKRRSERIRSDDRGYAVLR